MGLFLGRPGEGIVNRTALSKGNQVNIPEPGCGYWGAVKKHSNLSLGNQGEGLSCGNAIEFGDASGSPGKSCLFFLTQQSTLESDYLEIGYNARQSTALLAVSGALSMALENPKERMIFVPGRTDNRSRSPR